MSAEERDELDCAIRFWSAVRFARVGADAMEFARRQVARLEERARELSATFGQDSET